MASSFERFGKFPCSSTDKPNPAESLPIETFAVRAASVIFLPCATAPTAPLKQEAYPAANNCSGLVFPPCPPIETGIDTSNIQTISCNIFDIDIHEIPERKGVPKHLHHDVRFLLEADMNEPLIISSESSDLAWVELTNVVKLNNSESIMRMVFKTIDQEMK